MRPIGKQDLSKNHRQSDIRYAHPVHPKVLGKLTRPRSDHFTSKCACIVAVCGCLHPNQEELLRREVPDRAVQKALVARLFVLDPLLGVGL